MYAIEVSNLQKAFSTRQGWFGPQKTERALDGVSFHVDEGEPTPYWAPTVPARAR